MTPIIEVESLGKSYVIHHKETGGRSSVERARKMARNMAGRIRGILWEGDTRAVGRREVFWALRDLSFRVEPGEVVGIIGHNGAGKSTLLKLLSRITEPAEGSITLRGRVASLLEIGTGMNPQMTGRENIYLNGAILGMTQREVRRQFDQIVDFAGVEKFLDTPIKRYSSGMRVRLGFAVAAHLQPEILIVDEVLAVGDAQFQKKCIGKMQDVATGEGRTVLFVSHQMGAIRSLCQRVIVLREGRIEYDGGVEQGVEQYLASMVEMAQERQRIVSAGEGDLRLTGMELLNSHGESCDSIPTGTDARLRLRLVFQREIRHLFVAVTLRYNGEPVLTSLDTDDHEEWREERPAGEHVYKVTLPTRLLKQGVCSIDMFAGSRQMGRLIDEKSLLTFTLVETDENTYDKGYSTDRLGILRQALTWEREVASNGSVPAGRP